MSSKDHVKTQSHNDSNDKSKDRSIAPKRFNAIFLSLVCGGLVFIGLTVAIVDPLFHYHAPLKSMSYSLYDERYQNNGIVKHFTYDAMITGTSMTENFKASEADALFGTDTVKTCFMGGSYKEISDNIRVALDANPNLKLIIRATDQFDIISPADKHVSTDPETTFTYPIYLMDSNPFNDVEYILNKSLLSDAVTDIKMTLSHTPSTDFDEYSNWMSMYTFGKEQVLASYIRPELSSEIIPLTDEDRELMRANLEANVISLATDYPDVTFYTWIPPYSVAFYDVENRKGSLGKCMDAMEYECELLTGIDNIRLFGYADREDIVCDLSLYKDMAHYSEDVNSMLLEAMAKNEGLITEDNYRDYMARVRELYMNYDYDSIYE
ncbi:MAG: hypothetical protein K6E68_02530 [Lachnospiraceae bacterium]|nr:hypothetical protein [Lachnospiraceae bacterium]